MRWILFFQFFQFGVVFAEIDKAQEAQVKSVIELLEVDKFVASIEKIRSYKDPSQIDEVNYEMKLFFKNINYWFYFDQNDYLGSLKRNIRLAFTVQELKQINLLLKNPFYVKILKALTVYRDVFGDYHQLVQYDKNPSAIRESRQMILTSLFNGLDMNSQELLARKRLQKIIDAGAGNITMLGKTDNLMFVDGNKLKKRGEDLRSYLVKVLGEHLKTFRHYELREFLRVIKREKQFKKLSQMVINFHYLYLFNYIEKVEADKFGRKKALVVE